MIKIDLNPILVEVGPIRVTWYGMMYVFGFIISYLLVRYQVKKRDFGISLEEAGDLYFYLFL
jgi:phosphatidylglycerol:prolipoprotein diacylglycerol transferase